MQAYADRPLSDLESVDVGVRNRLNGLSVKQTEYGTADPDDVKRLMGNYHQRQGFVDLAIRVYSELDIEARSSNTRS